MSASLQDGPIRSRLVRQVKGVLRRRTYLIISFNTMHDEHILGTGYPGGKYYPARRQGGTDGK